jgi:NAD(P) transhydrogenase subunit alpha
MIGISGLVGLYIFMLAGFAGWIIIGRVPAILHTPLMSGSNFVHGIVVIGGILVLLNANTLTQQMMGFVAVGGRQCRRRLCCHGPDAGNVPDQRAPAG